jgi:D-serine deaminase-like pyridoxal phosphate-dependent protein
MIDTPLQQLETPCVLVDYDVLLENVRWAQQLASSRRLALRPHVKTHKCLEIARLQVAEGAAGITASKTDEALVFIHDGVRSVTVAYPVLDALKLDRLLEAAISHSTDLRLMANSDSGIAAIEAAALRHGFDVSVYLKIDVGLHRCGLREDAPNLVALARRASSARHLRLAGLLSHAGHAYGATTPEEVRAIAREECAILQRVRRRLEKEGQAVNEVSVGSTPTLLASDAYDGITEIRPGNYVFMDQTPVRLGLIGPQRIALSVMATVVSANSDYFIVDAGSKVLSSDAGAHGIGGSTGYGTAYPPEDYARKANGLTMVKLSEEHGFLRRGSAELALGSRVRMTPNHACPVANLSAELVVLREGQPALKWKVAARGCVQ